MGTRVRSGTFCNGSNEHIRDVRGEEWGCCKVLLCVLCITEAVCVIAWPNSKLVSGAGVRFQSVRGRGFKTPSIMAVFGTVLFYKKLDPNFFSNVTLWLHGCTVAPLHRMRRGMSTPIFCFSKYCGHLVVMSNAVHSAVLCTVHTSDTQVDTTPARCPVVRLSPSRLDSLIITQPPTWRVGHNIFPFGKCCELQRVFVRGVPGLCCWSK
jgi:hypothetical protein